LIGIVTHELRPEAAPVWAAAPGRSERDRSPARLSLRLSYTQALQEAGAIAVVLPAHGYADDAGVLLDRLDGLLFSGGPDLDPATYGAAPHPRLGPDVDRVADEYELALLAAATARDLPLLAICRGMQALNVARGGTLHQHLPDHTQLEHRQTHEPFEPAHAVTVTASAAACRSARTLPTARSRRCSIRPRVSASASSGTPSCSPTALNTRPCSARWWPPRAPRPRASRSSLDRPPAPV
jgi:hypothetical protein